MSAGGDILAPSSIVGLEWRLDYSVRSNEEGSNSQIFFLRLKIRDNCTGSDKTDNIRFVEIVATPEQLQDMLAKVRDAVKQVERVGATLTA